MPLPLYGSASARVVDAADISIHGDRYTDATIEPEAGTGSLTLSGSTIRVRIALHTCEGGRTPQPGDRIKLELLMGQITRVTVI